MIAAFLERLEAVFGWVVEASWQAAVLAGLVLLLQRVCRSRLNPRWAYALWFLVIARLLLPALPESSLSVFQFAPQPPPAVVRTVTEPIFEPPVDVVPVNDAETAPPPDSSHPFSVLTLLALTWLAGALVLFVLTLMVNRRFGRHVRNAACVADPVILAIADAARTELEIRRSVRVIESGQVQGPAIMGLVHPTLLLPLEAREKFTEAELRFIFLHEFAHLKRGDLFLQWLVALLQILHWFNPVLWYAFRQMRADREPATDALVLSRAGEAEAYGQVLIKLLEHYHRRHALPTLVGILEDRDQFKRRFQLIGQFTRGAYGWSLLGLFLIGILAAVCLTRSKLAPPSPVTKVISAKTDDASSLVRIALSAVQLGENDYQAHRAEIDDAVQKGDLQSLTKFQSFNLLSEPVALDKPGERCVMEEVRVMPYPVSWDPAFEVKNKDGSSVYGGPTPTDFKRQNLGVRSVLKPTIAGNAVDLLCNFEVVTFAGWTGPKGMQAANFNRRTLALNEPFQPNVAKGFQVPGGAQMEPADPTDIDFMDKPPIKPSPKSLVRLFAFFSVSIVDAKKSALTSKARADLDALYAAIQKNDREAVARLLREGADPNRHIYQQPLLAYARDAAMTKVLLEGGANPNEEDIFGTPLATAPNAECVRLLAQHGANVRHKFENGNSIIVAAIFSGHPDRGDVIEELIKQGADFDPHGPSGAAALTAAAQVNNLSVVKVLLDHGVSPNAFSDDVYTKKTAVGSAAWEPSTATLKYLIQRGANPAGDPREEDSPLAMALIFGQKENETVLRKAGAHDVCELSIAVADGDIAKVRGLLDKGANINEPDRLGNTPLYYACRRAQLEIARLLLSRGADPSRFNAYGMTPKASLDLMAASGNRNQYEMDWGISEEEGKRRMAAFNELLSKYPANPNFRDSHGRTALHQAIIFGNAELELINKGHPIDANTPDGDGIPPLLLAARSPAANDSNTRITTQGNDKTTQQKPQKWNVEAYIADQLIKAGAKLDLVVADGKTVGEEALDAARKANNAQLVSVIQAAMGKTRSTTSVMPISGGSVPNPPPMTDAAAPVITQAEIQAIQDSRTPLMLAFDRQDYAKARALLAQGADVNAKDKMGKTALGYFVDYAGAAGPYPLDILETLLGRAKEPNPQDPLEFCTPPMSSPVLEVTFMGSAVSRDLARESEIRKAVQLFLKHKATFAGVSGDVQQLLQAAARDDLPAIRQCIAKGTSVSATDADGWSPLLVAIALGYQDVAEWLIDHGANGSAATKRGAEDPLLYAAYRGWDDLLEKMIAHGGKTNMGWEGVENAVERNDQRLFDDFIKLGVDMKNGGGGYTLGPDGKMRRKIRSDSLYTCIEKNQKAMAIALLEKGMVAEPVDVEGNQNYTYWAVHFNRPEILQALLNHGANPLLKDMHGETPLSLAQKSHPDLVPMLEAAIAKKRDATSIPPASSPAALTNGHATDAAASVEQSEREVAIVSE